MRPMLGHLPGTEDVPQLGEPLDCGHLHPQPQAAGGSLSPTSVSSGGKGWKRRGGLRFVNSEQNNRIKEMALERGFPAPWEGPVRIRPWDPSFTWGLSLCP